jgi:GNAT superfamily N-acetyltransferase
MSPATASDIRLRPAIHDDRAGICAVHVRAIRETCGRAYSPEQVSAWSGLLSPDSYTAVLKERFLLVATDEGVIVAFGQLDRATGEVDAVYVRPDRQREGIGRRVLGALEAEARKSGIRTLELSATLNALSFYEAAGYTRRRPTVHRLPTGAELECVRMDKEL